MYAVAGAARPRHLLRARPGDVPRDGRRRDHPRRGVPLPAPPARRDAVRRPERDGARAGRRPPREAGIRITLLDTCYLAAGFGEPPEGVQLRFSDGDVERVGGAGERARAGRRRAWSAPRSTRCARCPRDQLDAVAGGPRPPAARPPVRAGRRERGLPRGVRRAPRRRLLAEAGPPRAERPPPCTRPTSPTATSRCSAATGDLRLLLPDHRARPRRRHRPAPPAARRRRPADPRQRQPRGDRPVRGDARGRARRAAGHPAARALDRRRAADRRDAAGHASARLRRRRPDRGRARAPTWSPLDTASPRTAGTGADEHTAVFAATAADVTQVMVDGAGRRTAAATASRDRARARRRDPGGLGRMSTHSVLTNIGELVTNDPERRGPARRDRRRGARRRGRQGRLGRPGRRRAGRRRARRRRRPRGAARASSTATATWSSPATGRRSSRPGWRASRTPPAASAPPSPPPAPPPTSSSPPTSRGWSRRCAARAPRPSRSRAATGSPSTTRPAAWRSPGSSPTRPRSSAPTSCPPSTRRPGGVRRPGHRPDARGGRTARPLDRRLLRARRVRRRPGARGSSRPAPPPGLRGRLHANQLGPGPGVRLAAELGPDRRRPLHLPRRRRRRRAARLGHHRHPAARASSSRPGSPTRTPARLLDAGVRSRWPATATPAPATRSSMPLCIALAVREMGMTPGRGASTPRRLRRRRGPRPRRRRRPRRRQRGRPGGARRARPTSTWPTAPAYRSSPAPGWAAGPPDGRRLRQPVGGTSST